jgi:serine/threonine protein kinase
MQFMLEVGQTLRDRYQLQQKLGQNAGRQTWLAVDLATLSADPVIVKLLAFGDQVQWDDLKLFEREAQILRQVTHPRIPKYRDYFAIEDRLLWFSLVYEYIPGTSFKQLLEEGRHFSEEQVQKFAQEVLEILQGLHDLSPPILHRDVKPSNLIFGQDNHLYLVDFGAVQDKAAKEGATFTVVGTYGYTPMEQFGGRAVPASDLYALGATLIHLVTGISPADLPQRNLQIQFSDRTSLDLAFIEWLEQLTHPDVAQRFESAHQAKEALALTKISREYSLTKTHIDRPRNTPIKLTKTKERLEIVIPKYAAMKDLGSGMIAIAAIPMILGFLLILSMLLNLLPVMAWLFISLVVIFLLFMSPWFERTYIRIDRRQFVVETQRFGTASSRVSGATQDIREVRREGYPLRQVVITSGPYRNGYRQDGFGKDLTDFEREWLAREIQKWLKFTS